MKRQTAFDFIDLHCDTITSIGALDDQSAAWSLSSLPKGARFAQCCAIFVPDPYRGDAAIRYYEAYRRRFLAECEKHRDRAAFCRSAGEMHTAFSEKKAALFLTVESGAALAGDLARVKTLADDGVKLLTLVWNGKNELGAGNDFPETGLTPFGREAVAALERENILIDVSHLNDRGFDDLCAVAQKPFAATHSNARTVCAHPRNLTDRQIREIVSRGGLIGLNYYHAFLRGDGREAGLDDLYRHICHFLSLGVQRALALGSDLDGADVPQALSSPGRLPALCEYLLSRGLSEKTVRAIAFQNAADFFSRIRL